MQAISENLKTLLKGKAMVGPNAPTAKLTLEGVNGKVDFEFMESPAIWRRCGKDSGYDSVVSNFVQDANGVEICAILNESTKEIHIGKMNANKDYFTKEYPVTSVTPTGIIANSTSNIVLYRRADGKLLMVFSKMPVLNTSLGCVYVYKSSNGLGTDFELSTTIEGNFIPTSGIFDEQQIKPIREMSDGSLLLTFTIQNKYSGSYTDQDCYVMKSTDSGDTWSKIHSYMIGLGACDNVSSCIELPDGTLALCLFKSSYNTTFRHSTDGGASWITTANNVIINGIQQHISDWLYDRNVDVLYAIKAGASGGATDNGVFAYGMSAPTISKIFSDAWDLICDSGSIVATSNYKAQIYKNYDSDFVLHITGGNDYIAGAFQTREAVEIPLKSVKIDREQSAMAQRLSAEIVNINAEDPTDVGYYTPFRGIDYPDKKNVFFDKVKPGTGVTCEMGYGTELTTVFTGAIDDVEISADTSYNIAIECRDAAWRLLDTTVASELGYYILYQNQTVEYMISDLLQKAGIASGDITAEATGITVAEISFAKCSYADAVEKLLDICGYDLICNELGKFSLVKPGVATSGGSGGGSGTGTVVFAEDHEAMTTETIEPTYYIVDGSNLVNTTSYWEIAADPADAGNKVIKLGNQAESGPPSYYRAEVACLDCTATDGDLTWLTYKMYIPSAHNNNSEWELIMQWHAQPGPGETWEDDGPFHGEPPVRLVRWSETPETYELWLHDPINLTYAKSDPFELPRDQWLNFTFEIYWSQGSDGYIQAWLDGNLLVPKMYHVNKCNVSPNYLQFGSYRRGKDESDNAATGDAVLYYDDIAIYTGGNIETTEPGLPTTAYEFTEGVDITKMGLKLTRNDIYARVQVTSRIDGVDGAPETYIVKEYVYENAADYGIPNHKTLFIDVQNITDETEIQNMANQIGYEMTRRLITVEFDCIPVFALQVGDIVKVTETSTTISEYYRVSAMSMGVDTGGMARMSLKCFHYGA